MSAGVKQRQNLELIAARMLDAVQHGKRPWAYQRLPHGLDLLLQRTDVGFRLALALMQPHKPSDTEEKVCRQAFKVPEWAQSVRSESYKNGYWRHLISIEWNAAGEG